MSKKTRESRDETQGDGPVVEFRPEPLPGGELPPEVIDAAEYAPRAYQSSAEQSGELLNSLTDFSVKASDAAVLGWVVKTPVTFDVRTTTRDDAESARMDVRTFGGVDEERLVEQPADHPFTVAVDTFWDVRVPENYVLLSYPLLNHLPEKHMTIPSVVSSEGESGYKRIKPRIEFIEGVSARVDRAKPISQLILTEEPAPSVETRALTEDEHVQVEKEERALDRFPDWYDRQRDDC